MLFKGISYLQTGRRQKNDHNRNKNLFLRQSIVKRGLESWALNSHSACIFSYKFLSLSTFSNITYCVVFHKICKSCYIAKGNPNLLGVVKSR